MYTMITQPVVGTAIEQLHHSLEESGRAIMDSAAKTTKVRKINCQKYFLSIIDKSTLKRVCNTQ